MDTHPTGQNKIDSTLREIDLVLVEENRNIEVFKALVKLRQSKDFKLVVEDMYMTRTLKKLQDEIASPEFNLRADGEDVLARIKSITDLKRFLGTDQYTGTVESTFNRALETIREETEFRNTLIKEANDNYTE